VSCHGPNKQIADVSDVATYFVIDAAWSERQLDECRLEQFTDELRLLVVEPNTNVALCTLLRTFGELLEYLGL